jgi:catechol 2,3-dioxygenase-like lactoylglutathione lyase family enzyme
MDEPPLQLLGLRTVIYPAPDLAASKTWFRTLLGFDPYFDEPFYVGFEVAGYELALLPVDGESDGPWTYWGVADIDVAMAALLRAGATVHEAVRDVGGDIRTASVHQPGGAIFGVIENPHFALPDTPVRGDGPGR